MILSYPWNTTERTTGRLSILAQRAIGCHRWKSLPLETAYGRQFCCRRESYICCFATILFLLEDRSAEAVDCRSSAEAVWLLYLLQKVKMHFDRAISLLVFIDCLVLLQNLQKWGRSDFGQIRAISFTLMSISLSFRNSTSGPNDWNGSRSRVLLVFNSMNWLMNWQIKAVPLTNQSSLGHRSMAPWEKKLCLKQE